MRSSILIKTTITSVFLLLAASLIYSQLLLLLGANGFFSSLVGASNSRRSNRLSTPFADVFPDRNLVLDLVQLNVDIYKVDKIYENPSDAITDDQFSLVDFLRTESSTEVMILSSDVDEKYASKPIVVFRGTEDYQDAMADGKIKRVKSKFVNAPDDVFIHSGFQHAVFDDDIVGQVERKVLEMAGENGEAIISGHSLGGAAAHIMAVYLADKYPNMNVTMINLGAPRLGNMEFKLWSEGLENLASWRYVFRRDTVPRLVPQSLGFDHAGHLFQVYRRGFSYYSHVYYRQTGNGNEYAKAPAGWYYGASVSQHLPRNYLKYFEENRENDDFWPTSFMKNSVWFYITQILTLPNEVYHSFVGEE